MLRGVWILVVVTTFVFSSQVSFAQTPSTKKELSKSDLRKASSANQILFDRDYKGRAFSGKLAIYNISGPHVGGYTVMFDLAECTYVADPNDLEMFSKLPEGSIVSVSGTIGDKRYSSRVPLHDCRFIFK